MITPYTICAMLSTFELQGHVPVVCINLWARDLVVADFARIIIAASSVTKAAESSASALLIPLLGTTKGGPVLYSFGARGCWYKMACE